jgi:hypothetical protein
MNYSFFLFCELAKLLQPKKFPSNLEYDMLFESLVGEYRLYVVSEFNDSYQPEYECIEKYLKSLKP